MPAGPRLILENACYHVTARGNQKQRVFLDEDDYQEFFKRLRKYKEKYGLKLYAFCLMPNHIHLVGELEESRHLARFMQALLRSYTEHFNKKHNKVGHLWQGRFNSRVITKDAYLRDCLNYVEFNPVRAGIAESAGTYCWSSYKERSLGKICKPTLVDTFRY